MNRSIEEARTRDARRVSPADLRTLNPSPSACRASASPSIGEIAIRLHKMHPTLDFDTPTKAELESGERSKPSNPWDLKYARLFDSSGDSGSFLKREDLEAERWVLGGDMIFRNGSDEALPLYEGQLINRYDHRARTYAGHDPAKKYGRKPGIPYTSDEAKSGPDYEIEPRYWLMSEQARGQDHPTHRGPPDDRHPQCQQTLDRLANR